MKIGIDIDGVIYNTENAFRYKAELYDLLELHKNGTVNNEFWAQSRYDWTDEQQKELKRKYFVKLSKEANLMPGAKEVINLLKKDAHEVVIVTARGGEMKEMRSVMEKKLQEENLTFLKYYWAVEDKAEICKKESIDVMIDDSPIICKVLAKNKIKTLYFRDVNREKLEENEYLKEVNNWGEIYRYIYYLNMEEK
ncbi:MAG: hypothetical protein J6A04_03935 [Clostridia bacterium]|nr:hypothetical protein [Clostridia bacterium]